jgi:hypothetical protein
MDSRREQSIFHMLERKSELFPWAATHGWNGWKRRYERQTQRFDPKIAKILKEHPEWRSQTTEVERARAKEETSSVRVIKKNSQNFRGSDCYD